MKMVPLGEVAQINPKPPKISEDTEITFVGMADLDAVRAKTDSGEIRPFAEVSKGYTIFQNDDILVAKITPCFENNKIGQAQLQRETGVGSTEFHVLRPGEHLDDRYLLHFLRQDRIRRQGEMRMTGSAGQRRVPVNFLRELKIPLPPLDEQRRIAAILDQADAVLRMRRDSVGTFDELARSLFLDASAQQGATEEYALGDVAEVVTGFAFKSNEYVKDGAAGVRLCRGANVLPGRIDWSDLAQWPQVREDEFKKFSLSPGDVVVAMDRPWISEGFKIARITEADCPALLVQRVARIRANGKANNEFIYATLNSPEFERYCRPTETTIPHISPVELREFPVNLPSDVVLEQFARTIRQVDRLRERGIRAVEEARAVFASLQDQAFAGQL